MAVEAARFTGYIRRSVVFMQYDQVFITLLTLIGVAYEQTMLLNSTNNWMCLGCHVMKMLTTFASNTCALDKSDLASDLI